jgi:hypothetical protein
VPKASPSVDRWRGNPIWSEEVQAWQLLYRTTDTQDRPQATVTTVLLPWGGEAVEVAAAAVPSGRGGQRGSAIRDLVPAASGRGQRDIYTKTVLSSLLSPGALPTFGVVLYNDLLALLGRPIR